MTDKLRQRAEELAKANEAKHDHVLSPEETRRALHELQVHKIELEMQNEELRNTQSELEIVRSRYFDLYDLAPVGYIIISEKGLILEANLTFAIMLGVARGELIKQPFSRFILNEDTDRYYLYSKQYSKEGETQSCELRIVNKSGAELWVHMQTSLVQNADGDIVVRAVLSNISELKRTQDLLQENETRFRLLFENAPLPYQSLDARGFFLNVNQKWLDTLGYTKENVIGRWFGDFLREEYVEHFDRNFPMFKQACMIDGVEFDMVTKNGETIRVSFNGRVQLDKNGKFLRTHCIFSDITERKRIEEELRASEMRYRLLAENIEDVIWTLDDNLNFTYASPSVESLLGFTPAELMATNALQTVMSPSKQAVLAALEQHRRAEAQDDLSRPIYLRIEQCRRNGSTVWVEIVARRHFDDQGRPSGFIGTSRDITKHKQAEQSLIESEMRFQSFMERFPNAVFIMDEEGRLVFANSYLRKLLGKNDPVGLNAFDMFPPDVANKMREEDRLAMETGYICVEEELKDSEGQIRSFSTHKYPLEVSGERLVCGISIDITESKQNAELRDEIERIIQHDLRTPAGSAISVAKLLSDNPTIAEQDRELLNSLEKSGQRMLDTLNQTLNVYNINKKMYKYSPESIDAVGLIREISNSLLASRQLVNLNVDVRANGSPALLESQACVFACDQQLLRLSLQNLIQNALEASPPGGTVLVDLNWIDGYKIEIRNKGVVPKDIRDRFFDKYVTKGKKKGTGIGTYSAKMMIEAQGGSIEMQTSDEDNETIITIHMPV